jgi:ABC-type glycerol-3-phosphate transport system substrate-binding protein
MKLMSALVLAAVMAGFAPLSHADEKKAEVVREVTMTGLVVNFEGSNLTQPTKITSLEEMKKLFGEGATEAKIDFTKEYLVFFHWSGSGQDKLTAATSSGEKPKVTFMLKRGLTRDLRNNWAIFALKTGVEFVAPK